MNSTQIQTTLAPLLTFLAGLAAGKGLFGWDATTWYTILGGAVGFGATIWAAVATSGKSIVAQAANNPEVQSIKLVPTASAAMVDATPANVTK